MASYLTAETFRREMAKYGTCRPLRYTPGTAHSAVN